MQVPCFEMARLSPDERPGARLSFLEHAADPDQEDGADDRDHDGADESSGVDAERAQEPSAHDGADYAEDDIHRLRRSRRLS